MVATPWTADQSVRLTRTESGPRQDTGVDGGGDDGGALGEDTGGLGRPEWSRRAPWWVHRPHRLVEEQDLEQRPGCARAWSAIRRRPWPCPASTSSFRIVARRAHRACSRSSSSTQPVWSAEPVHRARPLTTAEAKAPVFAEGAAGVADAVDAGLPSSLMPVLVSLTIWSTVHGSRPSSPAGPGRDDESALVESVIDAIVDGLRP